MSRSLSRFRRRSVGLGCARSEVPRRSCIRTGGIRMVIMLSGIVAYCGRIGEGPTNTRSAVVRAAQQSAHISDPVSVGDAVAWVVYQLWIVVGDQRGRALPLPEGLHDLVHVLVSVILKSLMKTRQR